MSEFVGAWVELDFAVNRLGFCLQTFVGKFVMDLAQPVGVGRRAEAGTPQPLI
ncbi:MAG TPA: hypothetical protein QF695_10430 [Arenicellales bacterium]|nr:hypothetical protein [Pseudomonadales bacterium]HJL53039.1 hypothetical protein [Arenicellales bacterium]